MSKNYCEKFFLIDALAIEYEIIPARITFLSLDFLIFIELNSPA
jgi:hypothetical protein